MSGGSAPLERLPGNGYRTQIPGGSLRLWMEHEAMPLPDALDFAARNNPRRRFLFVSRVLGRHLPTRPAQLRGAAAALAAELNATNLAEPCLFLGMAETATTLGQAVFREWIRPGRRGLYLDTTRRRTGGPVAFSFTEAHSHAPGHLVHLPSRADDPDDIFRDARTLVIVDDEATTGRTAEQLFAAYQSWGGRAETGRLAVLVHWRDPGAASFSLRVHSLLSGRFEFTPAEAPAFRAASAAEATRVVLAPLGTRHGLMVPQSCPWASELAGRVLVVGAGEFGFQPLLLAEAIESAGGEAFLQATTRSPVAYGGAISHIRAFPALSGEGYDEFLYNVPDEHTYDRVILCCEDRLPPPGHPLLALPRLECRLAPAQ